MMIQEINRKNYQRLIKIKTTDQKRRSLATAKKKRGRMIKLVVDDEKIKCVKK